MSNPLFVPGNRPYGRAKGTPNKRTVMGREFAEKLVKDPEYLANVEARAKAGKLHPGVEAMLWYYAMGKPKESLELSGSVGTRDVREMSTDELLAELEAHQQHTTRLLTEHHVQAAAALTEPPDGN